MTEPVHQPYDIEVRQIDRWRWEWQVWIPAVRFDGERITFAFKGYAITRRRAVHAATRVADRDRREAEIHAIPWEPA